MDVLDKNAYIYSQKKAKKGFKQNNHLKTYFLTPYT